MYVEAHDLLTMAINGDMLNDFLLTNKKFNMSCREKYYHSTNFCIPDSYDLHNF